MATVTEACEALRDTLVPRWAECFFSSYPLGAVGLSRTGTEQFTNPIGHTTRNSLGLLYTAISGQEVEPAQVHRALEDLFHVRAIQDMAPSKAVGALYLLKPLLRQHLLAQVLALEKQGPAQKAAPKNALGDYLSLESRIDSLALMALDIYAQSREKVIQLRVEEIKRSQSQVLRWASAQKGAAGALLPQCQTCKEGVEE